MVLPPSGRAPGLRPLPPLRLVLVALAIPAASLFASLTTTLIAMGQMGFGSSDEILQRLADTKTADAAIETAVEVASLSFEGLLLLFTLAFVWRRGTWGRDALAWVPWPKDQGLLPFLGLMLAWQAIEGWLIEPRFPDLGDYAQLPHSQPALLLSLVTVALVAPLTEELFFRGFLYTNLRAYVGFPLTIVATAVYFAALHFGNSIVLPLLTLPFGLIAGLARERYGSVKPAIYLHIVWNMIAWGSEYFWTAPLQR